MDFIILPGNPVPEGFAALTCAGDNNQLRCAYWLKESQIKRGTIVLMPGFGEAIELHFSLINDLLVRGFAVFTFDWRGQGGSGRLCRNLKLGHIDSLQTYCNDFNDLIRAFVLPELPAPYFVLASDMGANVFLDNAPAPRSWCARALLVSPLVALSHGLPHIWRSYRMAKMACWLGFADRGVRVAGGEVDKAVLASDLRTANTKYLDLLRKGQALDSPLTVDTPTYGLVSAVSNSMKGFSAYSFPSRGHVPMLMLCGSGDRIIEYGQTDLLAQQLRGGGALTLKGGRHKLLFEEAGVLKQFWNVFDNYIAKA